MVLIDTWWNVNQLALVPVAYNGSVLIDTWWNVNINMTSVILSRSSVLIDTWWNVNQMPYTVDGYANWF